eukprot:3015760-Rhodomonas_salina.2
MVFSGLVSALSPPSSSPAFRFLCRCCCAKKNSYRQGWWLCEAGAGARARGFTRRRERERDASASTLPPASPTACSRG